MFSEFLDVTPDLAEALLERNPDNRRLKTRGLRSVEAYANAMLRGEWVVNGASAIAISKEGLLNDGQNRLWAVIRSGCTVAMQFTFGVERESRNTVDLGAGRSPGDTLMMAGEKNTTHLASAVRFVWGYDSGGLFHDSPSTDQLLDTLVDNPALREQVTRLQGLRKEFSLSAGLLTGAYHLCHRADPTLAEKFLEKVETGVADDRNNPVLRLRRRYLDHATKRGAMVALEQAALFIKAFNAYREGRTMKTLQWRYTNGEEFPTA